MSYAKYTIMDHEKAQAFVVTAMSEKGDEQTTAAMFYYDYGQDKETIHNLAKLFAGLLEKK